MSQAEREAAIELRSVAPLYAGTTVIGACTIVASGDQTIGFTSAELLRRNEAAGLSVGKTKVRAWSMGRYTGIGLVELVGPPSSDITPLPIAAICATVDTRGSPAAIVTFDATGAKRIIPVHVDPVGGMDVIARLATAVDAIEGEPIIDGAALFAWFPPERALGRPAATLAVAVGYAYVKQTFKPRDKPAIAELVGLEDLGRAMSWSSGERPDPKQVAGEFDEHELPKPPADP